MLSKDIMSKISCRNDILPNIHFIESIQWPIHWDGLLVTKIPLGKNCHIKKSPDDSPTGYTYYVLARPDSPLQVLCTYT
jgi:hypothetical protein